MCCNTVPINSANARKKFAEELNEDSNGNCWKIISQEINIWSIWAKKNPDKIVGWDKVGVEYNSMEISKGIIMKMREID
jgi:hypothetical protein